MNLATLIDAHPAERTALLSRGQPMTYGELRDAVARARGAFASRGIGAGDRVAMLCVNDPSFVVTYLAVVGLGAVAVPLNPSSPTPEIEAQLAHVEPKAIVVAAVAQDAWTAVNPIVAAGITTVVSSEGSTLDGAAAFDELVASGEPLGPVDLPPEALAVLMFTSGTVGAPRAAMLSHGNLLSNIERSALGVGGIDGNDVVYDVLPLHHIFGLNVVLTGALRVGAALVLVQRFDPATALETIIERNVSVVPGAPPMWVAWSQFGDVPAEALGRVRLALTGAAKMPEDVSRTLRDRFGLELREGYGLTEAGPVVTTSVGIPNRIGSVGRVIDGVDVRLVDPDGTDVLDGDAGEIWVSGPSVFLGYWRDEDATRRALTPDGWLRTGDIATVDDDGYLYIVDRAKDLIIVSGFNVYPAEVEDVISELDGVSEVGVVGVAHPHTGESVKAYVVLDDGIRLDEDAVIAHCADNLARYKCPTKVMFVPELPKSVIGKVLRRELR